MEEELITKALDNFTRLTAVKVTGKELRKTPGIDGVLNFAFPNGPEKIMVEAKKELRNHHLGQLLQLQKDIGTFIVLAETIFPNLRIELKKNDINYLDLAGNAFIKTDKNFIFIDGQKRTVEKTLKNKVFTKTGIKVIFQFLNNPELINATYREIAETADVALDTVYKVINGLKEQRFVLNVNKDQMKLTNLNELLERWLTVYDEQLKPTLFMERFRFLKDEDFLNWKKIPLNEDKTLWGGEPAAALITNYLKPTNFTLYTTEARAELLKNYKLVPDTHGAVWAYKKFWPIAPKAKDNVVPEILVYTDLMNTGDPRCIETAEKIYERDLQNRF